jgi:lysophospholipid acyltransferase (LPLAT)-like uncharacterized protein
MAFFKKFGTPLLVQIVYYTIRLLRLTWTMKEQDYPGLVKERIKNNQPTVFGHLHEHDWPLIAYYFFRPVVVLVSLSEDGSLLTQFLKKLKFFVARGSSSRGAVSGVRQILSLSQENKASFVTLAVDGPRGPRREPKMGVIKLAQHLDSPVMFGWAEVDSAIILHKSWSKALIPKPFAKMQMRYKEIISLDEIRASKGNVSEEKRILEKFHIQIKNL